MHCPVMSFQSPEGWRSSLQRNSFSDDPVVRCAPTRTYAARPRCLGACLRLLLLARTSAHLAPASADPLIVGAMPFGFSKQPRQSMFGSGGHDANS